MSASPTNSQSASQPTRLLVIANRLPVSIALHTNKETGKTEIKTTRSSGGLVSALQGLSSNPAIAASAKQMEQAAEQGFKMKWIGWPGTHLPSNLQPVLTDQLAEQDCIPVYLDAHLTDLYYNGFCNNVLWPLFHYIPLPLEAIQNLDEQYTAYVEANHIFAEAILREYRDGDLVWIHDYHLMTLPRLVRDAKPDAKIGFFFHTPFPSSEIYRTLPPRKELLRGVLASNLLGFHTHDYQRHFQSACSRLLGASITSHIVRHEGFVSFLGAFPIGIDPEKFIDSMEKAAVKQQIEEYKEQFRGRKVLIGIDRLDYIKGIYNKLLGLERFFEQHPEWAGKVVLVQVAVPSRTDVPEYKRLRRTTHELVARINGKFGDIATQPIHYLDQSVPFDRMVAIYRFSDAALITSIRDGMNLVAFEYVVAQKDQGGALILSEFAGAAQSLGAGCITFNPWSLQEVADAIYTALLLTDEDAKQRAAAMYDYVVNHTARHWAQDFIDFMQHCVLEQEANAELQSVAAVPPSINMNAVVSSFRRSRSKLIVLGVGGCLTRWQPLMSSEFEVKPLSKSRPRLAQAITKLANDPNVVILLTTSMGRDQLDALIDFYGPGLWLAAENGFFLSHHTKPRPRINSDDASQLLRSDSTSGEGGWKTMYHNVDFSWKEPVLRVFEHFADRTPGTFIKEQDTYVSWHYDKATDKQYGEQQAALVLSHLTGGPLNNTPTEVLHLTPKASTSTNVDAPEYVGNLGSCIIVRPLGVTKGTVMKQLMNKLTKQVRNKQPLHNVTVDALARSGSNQNVSSDNDLDTSSSDDDESEADAQQNANMSANIQSTISTSSDQSPITTPRAGGAEHGAFHNRGKRPKQLNTQLDRTKFPFDFVLVAGSFVDKDEDVFICADEYAESGQQATRSGRATRSPAMTSSRSSPRGHAKNPSTHSLTSYAASASPDASTLQPTTRPGMSGAPSPTATSQAATYSSEDQTAVAHTPVAGQSTPTGYLSQQQDAGLFHGSDQPQTSPQPGAVAGATAAQNGSVAGGDAAALAGRLKGLNVDVSKGGIPRSAHSRQQSQDTAGEDGVQYPAAQYSSYSLPSPSLSSTNSPAFPPIRNSRARSSSTENMAQYPEAGTGSIVGRSALGGRFAQPTLRQPPIGHHIRSKPAVFTSTVGNVASKAHYKLPDTVAVEQLIISLAQIAQ